jgi:ribosome-binding protein aMBF1 (putative translation factor)
MSVTSIGAALDRVRAFRRTKDWAPFKLATEAGVAEASLRGMDEPTWNPTARTVEKLEAVIPVTWQPGDPVGDDAAATSAAGREGASGS